MKLEQELRKAVIEAVKALYGQDVTGQQVSLQKTVRDLLFFLFYAFQRKVLNKQQTK